MTKYSTSNELIENFDPNVRWGRKKIEVILQQWDYRKTFVMEHGGNTIGFSNLECAVSNILDTLETREIDGEQYPFIIMTNPNGDTCEFEPDDERASRWDKWIENMVVSVRLLEVIPDDIEP